MPPASRPPPPALPAHATRGVFTVYVVLGGVLAALGALLVMINLAAGGSALLPVGALYMLFGALVGGYGIYGRAVGSGVQVLNSSLNLIGLGRLTEADALIEHVERSSSLNILRRVADLQRAMIAMRRGDLATALTRSTAAVERPMPRLGRAHARIQVAHARALRAMLRASTGDEAGTRADVAAVRASPEALPQALARATLAEAILYDHAGRRADLAALLAGNRRLLLEATDPRERALVRTFQRMLKSRATTAYRNPGTGRAGAEEGAEPSARSLVGALPQEGERERERKRERKRGEGGRGEGGEATWMPVAAARGAAPARRSPTAAGSRRREALTAVAFVVTMLVAYSFVTGGGGPGGGEVGEGVGEGDPTSALARLIPVLLVVLAVVIGVRVRQVMRGQRETRRLQAALADLAGGSQDRGARALEELTASPLDLVAAQAHLHLAIARQHAAALEEALACCDRGLARLTRYGARLAAADLLLPQLAAERAFLLCALDRPGEAHAELAALPSAYPFLARDFFRVRLLELCRGGDLRAAAALVEGRAPDLPLGPYDELLADAVRAAVSPESAGAGEVARLKEELGAFIEGRRWIEAVAPAVLRALEAVPEDDDGFEGSARARALALEQGEEGEEGEADAEAARISAAEREADAEDEAEAEASVARVSGVRVRGHGLTD